MTEARRMRQLALLWLIVVGTALSYVSYRLYDGLHFRTDLLALLPREEQDPVLQRANDVVTKALSQRVLILIGDQDRLRARQAAAVITDRFRGSGLIDLTSSDLDTDQLKNLGSFFYPYRGGLLADDDREALQKDNGDALATRALSEVYGFPTFANPALLHGDPLLLFPHFLTQLPLPLSRLSLDEGVLSVTDHRTYWVLVAGRIKDEPFALQTQQQVTDLYDHAVHVAQHDDPTLRILHLGAVFFAKAGATQAMSESSSIGTASMVGTALFILLLFRAATPLLLNMLVIGVGILTALAVSLWTFGELHVGALLFGVSLIGVAVDYSLQYCAEIFAPGPDTPHMRMSRIFWGITLGAATTIVGYLTLMLAPFPGLHQIALFSAVGLIAAWLTVVLWLPHLDNSEPPRHRVALLAIAAYGMSFWGEARFAPARKLLLLSCLSLAAFGYFDFHADDDVRHLQSLSPPLMREQERLQNLLGSTIGNQFFLVQAKDDETALQLEEVLAGRLHALVSAKALTGFQSASQYVPSIARQTENRFLIRQHVGVSLLRSQQAALHLKTAVAMPDEAQPYLTLDKVREFKGNLSFLSLLLLDETPGLVTHVVTTENVSDLNAVSHAADNLIGVRLINPTGDFSSLLRKYRERALFLLAVSAFLMAPLLLFRYGFPKGLWIMVPSCLAVGLTPFLRALTGGSFTFFDAMGLVLILSVGIDYSVFCAETSADRKAVTMLAVFMAACTAVLSFGLLALSTVFAVHNFGMTMLIGIVLAFVFSPLARYGPRSTRWSHAGLILVTLLLGACAADPVAQEPKKIVMIGPATPLTLPAPRSLKQKVDVVQFVTAHFGDQSASFEARVHADSQHFRLICLDLMGRTALKADWTDSGINYETAPWLPPAVSPEDIIADMVVTYWPIATVEHSLAQSTVVTTPHHRKIYQGDDQVIDVTYEPVQGTDLWSGIAHFANLSAGYSLDIQSVAAK